MTRPAAASTVAPTFLLHSCITALIITAIAAVTVPVAKEVPTSDAAADANRTSRHPRSDGIITQMSHEDPVALATTPVARPSPQQLAWQDLEVGAMLCFNLQTICRPSGPGMTHQRCQKGAADGSPLYVPDQDTIRAWDLSGLDTDEWAQTAASFGATYVVLVADHMTGFTLWNTTFHNYSVASTNYKGRSGTGNVLRDMITSCKKYGLKLGYFYSMHFNWFLGVNDYKVGFPPLGPRSYTQEEYLDVAAGQIREISAHFGSQGPAEVWFDGGPGSAPSTSALVGPLVRAASPNAVCHSCYANYTRGGSVRWMGNELAQMPLPSWGAADSALAWAGDPEGAVFVPPSSDAVLREHYWFWQNHTAASTKSTLKLVQNYLTTVGRAANLILNVAPDGTGATPAADRARYAEMGKAIKCLFSMPVGGGSSGRIVMAQDGTMEWQLKTPLSHWSNVSLVLQEDQTNGQLIGNYTVECMQAAVDGGSGGNEGAAGASVSESAAAAAAAAAVYEPCPMLGLYGTIPRITGPGVGHKRILVIGQPANASPLVAIRVRVQSHFATKGQIPALRDIALYDWSGAREDCVAAAEAVAATTAADTTTTTTAVTPGSSSTSTAHGVGLPSRTSGLADNTSPVPYPLPPLPKGPIAPSVTPAAPKPAWSWDYIPLSFHGAVKDRTFNAQEIERLARYQMITIEKWYTPCGSATYPHQSGPACAVERKAEAAFAEIRAASARLKRVRPTAILYWNSMFAFAMYEAYQGMLDLEREGVHAFLRDKDGIIVSLCNDGNVYCNVTSYDWTEPRVRELWVSTVANATRRGIDGIFADHSASEGTLIGFRPPDSQGNNGQGPNQLCNGKGPGRECFNFTHDFAQSFNSWHLWATNFTQDLLARTTGGPVIQGALASMNNATTWGGHITDASFCSFDSIRQAQASGMAVFEARGPCAPPEHCLAAYLAAAEEGTYVHCTHNGDDILQATAFPEMDKPLGAPTGPAREVPASGSGVWKRVFASGTTVFWDNNAHIGNISWSTAA